MVTQVINKSAERDRLRRDVIQKYLRDGLKTADDLHRFITTLTREPMPCKPICSGHQTPFHYMFNSFFADYLHPITGEYMGLLNQLAIASRGGSKTSTTGKNNVIDLIFKPGVEVASVGAVKTQAAKCYKYTTGWLMDPDIVHLLAKEPTMQETKMLNGASYSQLVGTKSGVNSPHPQKLRADEIELLKDPTVLDEMFMVPMSFGGYRGTMDITSTRKYQSGIMQKLVDNADEMDLNLIIWCYKEVAEECKESRRGIARLILDIEDPITKEVKPYNMYEGCEHCKLAFSCKGDLVHSRGYYAIDDYIREKKRLSKTAWIAQKECQRPGSQNVIYADYDDEIDNVHSNVIPNCHPPSDWYIIECYDFGVTAISWWAMRRDGREFIKFAEYKNDVGIIDHHLRYVKETRETYDIQPDFIWGDPRSKNLIAEWRNRGVPIKRAYSNVEVGLEIIGSLMDRDLDGSHCFYICERCVKTRDEYKAYHFKVGTRIIPKQEDHLCDTDRYGIVSTIGVLRLYGDDLIVPSEEEETSSEINFTRPDTDKFRTDPERY